MSINELNAKVNDLRGLYRLADELEAEIDAIENEIRRHMDDTGAEKIIGNDYKITYTAFESRRVDTTALKQAMPDIAERFTRSRMIRRLVVT